MKYEPPSMLLPKKGKIAARKLARAHILRLTDGRIPLHLCPSISSLSFIWVYHHAAGRSDRDVPGGSSYFEEDIYECIRVARTQGARNRWSSWIGRRDGGGTGTRWRSRGSRGHPRGYRQGYGRCTRSVGSNRQVRPT